MKPWNAISATLAIWALVQPSLSQDHGGAESKEVIQPPVPVYKVSPKHPQRFYDDAIEGEAIIIVTIDMFGNVKESEVKSATQKEFGRAASLAASEWVFEPATKNGIPMEIRVNLPFLFEIAFEHKINVQIGREVFVKLNHSVVPSSDLKQKPRPKYVPPFTEFYPEELRGSGRSASVNLEFVISPTGEVLNPQVLSISTDGFDKAAVLAVSHMIYHPVLVEGSPVYVSTVRPIQLSE